VLRAYQMTGPGEIGLVVAARISLARGWLVPRAYDRLIGVLELGAARAPDRAETRA
jgi:hypothetical protein